MKNFFFSMIVLLAVAQAFAQRTVSGKVTDDTGEGLPGVNVVVKGTTTGVTTDLDGNYQLSVEDGATLVFSYVGFETQEIEVGSRTSIDVTLSGATELDEVVVLGYGTSPQRSYTGTANTVKKEDIENKNFSNVSQSLAGEVPGVNVFNTSGQPGTTSTIRIRGFGSVNGNRNPLYVVDGVPFSGSINSINPADIESVTVLKDAASTAIYGARGANGVIVITTKSGKSGESSIEFDMKTGFNVSLLPRQEVIKSPEEYIALAWEGKYTRGVIESESDPVAFANEKLFGRSGIGTAYNMWNVANVNELIDPDTWTVREGVTRRYSPENWEDHAFQRSQRTEANLRISGGDNRLFLPDPISTEGL